MQRAQQPATADHRVRAAVRRLSNGCAPSLTAFRRVCGNSAISRAKSRSSITGEGRTERLPEMAAELVRRQASMSFWQPRAPAALAAKQATSIIPIVFALAGTRSRLAWSQASAARVATSRA